MRKGMSQTLTLVVIASVLMMTGLTVAILGQDIVGGGVNDFQNNSCARSVSQTCDTLGSGQEFTVPASCDESSPPPTASDPNTGDGQWKC